MSPKPSRVELALGYAREGFHVFPVGADKKPLTAHGFTDATTDPEAIATWWAERPKANIGIATGASGLVVVDLDRKDGKDGIATWKKLAKGIEGDHPIVVRTPSGGRHLVYSDPKGKHRSSAGKIADGVDVRAAGGYIVAAGSKLPNGRYELVDGHELTRARLHPLPKKLAKLLATKSKTVMPSAPTTSTPYAELPAPTRARIDAYMAPILDAELARLHELAEKAIPGTTGYVGPPWDSTVFEVAAVLHELMAPWTGYDEERLFRLFADAAPVDTKKSPDGRKWNEESNLAKWESARRKVAGKLRPLPEFRSAPEVELLDIDAPEGDELLDRVREYTGRFIAYPSDHAHVAHVLWIAHAHLIECFENTPRLAFLSPEPGSGKSRALEITHPLVPRPVVTINSTAAYTFRKISDPDGLPTLLFDEVDAIFGRGKDSANEELRGLLNSGYRKGASAGRAAIRGKEVVTEEWPSFCAVALAGLGDLPDTLMTRSVVVRMKRRKPDEPVSPYRTRIFAAESADLYAGLATWASEKTDEVRENFPPLPEGIEDRDADVWEPLIAVADAAGGRWPAIARDAALALVAEAHDRPATLGVRLLADIRRVFGNRDRIRSIDLLGELIALEESPWETLNGQPIDARFIAKMLGKYGIPPAVSIRFEHLVAKGYHRKTFSDAFERYLPPLTRELELLEAR